ncbi:MAG: hypothetical protein H0V44_12670 [Planctomycetes bacterium]|nr:hypothetical protein [Planctomycetota bacterium]
MLRLISVLMVTLACALANAQESLESKIAETDMNSAESVFELANWCKTHNLPMKSRQYLSQVIKIDKDHEGARTAMGQVRVGDRWVSATHAPPGTGQPKPGDEAPVVKRTASGPGPKAADIAWDLSVPKDPAAANTFITKYVERMSTVANDSHEMDVSVATCLAADYLPSAVPRLCAALARSDFTDLYGASSMVSELVRKGKTDEARPLLPFLVKASERVSDPTDLECFAYAIGLFKDRRAVPRLIELMGSGNDSVKNAAASAVAAITLLPDRGMSVATAQEWWDLNHSVSERETYQAQLRSADAAIAVEAAKALYPLRDTSIIPVLIKCLRSEDKHANLRAASLIAKITGTDWNYDPAMPAEQKAKIADRLDAWWKQEQGRFTWIEDRKAQSATNAVPKDANAEMVSQLDSREGDRGQLAESGLMARGDEAIPALIDGLSTNSSIVRRKCNDILRAITKQDFQFDARDSDEARAKAVAAWKAWNAARSPAKTDEATK